MTQIQKSLIRLLDAKKIKPDDLQKAINQGIITSQEAFEILKNLKKS